MTSAKTKLAAATAASALLLAGCAGNGDGGGSEAGGGDGVLNVGQISDSIAFFPLHVAEENGYFEDEGVTLGERPRLGNGSRLAAALNSDSIDVAAGVATDVLNLAQTNPEVKATGTLVNEYYVDVIVSDGFDGPDADAPLEERIRALEGKTIGITGPGSGTEALLIYLFDQVGLDAKNDATLVNLDASPSAAVGAMESGQVDALSFFQPTPQMAETSGAGEIYISPQRGDIPDMAGQFHGALFSTEEVLENKGDEVASFNAAIDSALTFIEENPEETSEILAEYLEGTDEESRAALEELLPEQMPASTTITEEAFAPAMDFHLTSGLVSEETSYEDVVWEEARE